MNINKKNLRVWGLSAVFFIAIAVRIAIIYRQNIVIQNFSWNTSWYWILSSIAIMALGWLLAAWVWSDLMITLGSRLSLSTHIRYYCITQLSRRIPGKVWFLAGRGYLYQQHGESLRVMGVASGLEWFISVLSGGIISLIAINYSIVDITKTHKIYIVVALIIAFILIQPQTIRWLLQWMKLPYVPKLSYQDLIKWLGAYGSVWFLGGIVFYLTANIVTPIPIAHFPHILSSWTLIGTISILAIFIPTNLGLSDVGLTVMLRNIMPISIAIVIAMFTYLLFIVYEIITIAIILLCLSILEKYRIATTYIDSVAEPK